MVEVEKISHFRKWFGIDLNVRDLFLDHPGMFYLSTKGKRHTVFLREAYERGCLIESNPVYEARRKLLDLVLLGCRGWEEMIISPIMWIRVKKMKWKRCTMIEVYSG
ncbi:UNVERIFIED_CONTAM: protein ROOT PRIMORDIUM defective [Sesamum latifolium]|uniref:Protein ROOT PRIMORDIUM defective n=1 Tax=Sesamum latifolium TaxID=2727402 RepID=A0AAW2YAT0_9LAMI